MIGIDTNVLVRHLTNDDPALSPKATAFLDGLTEEDPGFVSREVLVELYWVLSRAFKLDRVAVAEALLNLIDTDAIAVECGVLASEMLNLTVEKGLDFADLMIAAAGRAAGCSHTVTFDRKAAKISSMKLLH